MIAIVAMLVLVVAYAVFVTYLLVRATRFMMRYEDHIEQALDELDTLYASMSALLRLPVISNSPEIQMIIEKIKTARNNVLVVANKIARHDDKKDSDVS